MFDLRFTLSKNNCSIAQLSRTSGIPIRTLEDITARGDCRFSTASKIAKALGIPVDDLSLKNCVFASCESTFEKACKLQPPFRTPCVTSDAGHFIDAAKEVEALYKDVYPDIFNARNITYFSINGEGENVPFSYSFSYREFDDESPDLP